MFTNRVTQAKEVGIVPSNFQLLAKDVYDSMVMTASQFDSLSDEEIDALPELPLVIARCAPQTKVRMIEALHRRGKFVAMTGESLALFSFVSGLMSLSCR